MFKLGLKRWADSSVCSLRCHCSTSSCSGGFDCEVLDDQIRCTLPQVSQSGESWQTPSFQQDTKRITALWQLSSGIGFVEIIQICASVLGLLSLVVIFVIIRKRYVQHKKKKPACVQDSNGWESSLYDIISLFLQYKLFTFTCQMIQLWTDPHQLLHLYSCFQSSLGKDAKATSQEVNPMEMNSLVGSTNNLDHTPFRSLRPRSQISSSGGRSPKTHGPVVCSVAPNLPARPPSSSDNDSIRKGHWDMDYEGEFWEHFTFILGVFLFLTHSEFPSGSVGW